MHKDIVYRGKVFTVREYPVRMPDGSTATFEQVERVGTVVVLPIDDRGRLWMTREKRHSYRGWQWFLPVGRVERGINPRAAARKELKEEIGKGCRSLRLFYRKERTGRILWPLYAYIAQGLSDREKTGGEPDEQIVSRPMPLKKAFALARSTQIKDSMLSLLIMTLWYERAKWL